MKKQIIIGSAMSVILIIINQIIIQYALYTKRDDSVLINIAGRQRMLSQKLNLSFHRLYEDGSQSKHFEQEFDELKIGLKKILNDSSTINKSLISVPQIRSTWIESLSTKIEFLNQQADLYKNTGKVDLDAIDKTLSEHLAEMEEIVARLVVYSEKKLSQIIMLEIILAALSILLIFIKGRYIYLRQARIMENSLLINAKNRELEQFNYIASHDLQEPLRTVSNYLIVLKEDYSSQVDNEFSVYLDTIEQAANRMKLLIRSLLDYSRLGNERKLALIDTRVLLNNVIADLSSLVESTHAKIVVGKLPEITGYETELRQLFQNLLTNAIKFHKKNLDPEIRVDYIGNHKYHHEFSVSDNGIGIDPKYFDRIFYMFQVLNKNTQYEGYGIGLANCKKIVELHGGKIWVESAVEKGSVFKFTLLKNIQ